MTDQPGYGDVDEGAHRDFQGAVDSIAAAAGPVLVLIESADGLAGRLIDLIPTELGELVRAEGAAATRVKVGCVAEELKLDEVDSGVVVLENAQWADPTSLGRLQRKLRTAGSGLLVVVAYRPLSGAESWGIDQLRAAGRRQKIAVEVAIDTHDTTSVNLPEDPRSRELLVATSLVSNALTVPIVARLLNLPEEEALTLAESLADQGLLRQSRGGFRCGASGVITGLGDARVGHVAARLADAMDDTEQDRAVVGALRLAAGDSRQAFPHLLEAAAVASEDGAAGEAFHLAEAALEAADEARVGSDAELGTLHLISGRYLRAAGRSEFAVGHLERATALLEGAARVDAMGFAAAVADDRQHPQDSERILAMAEMEAFRLDEAAKVASLGTFRARALNRIGFAAEADALLEKSVEILAGDTFEEQRHYADVNRAWISFDRGQVARAEAEFTRLRDATSTQNQAAMADREAWRSRALFACGRPLEALEAVDAARESAQFGDVEAPLFLADLALTEGNLLFSRHQEALEASERVLDLVERQLPAWENVARSSRAAALAGLGRLDEARSEISAALAVTPPGANGWRWRSRCRAIQMEIEARAGQGWDRQEAIDLADLFLQSELYGWAAELLCVIAEQGRDREIAGEAAALAHQIGNPMLAARAAEAGKLWKEPVAAPVIRAVRSMEPRVPAGWQEAWQTLPSIAAGLAAPEPTVDEAGTETADVVERALRRVGLAGETVLSPAQRRKSGLVRRRRPRRPLLVAAAALGVIALTAATSVAIAELSADPPPVTVVREVTSPPPSVPEEAAALEETEIPVPDDVDFFFGTAADRGGPGRHGYVDTSGPRAVDGYYWTFSTADPIVASPVAYGNNVLVGSNDGTFYALNQTTGEVAWTMASQGGISAAPSLGSAELGEGQTSPLVVVVADDGIVRARDALLEVEDALWTSPQIGTRIRSSPVASQDRVFVATTDGVVFALSLFTGEELWRFPQPDSDVDNLGPISAGLTYADGVLYVATEQGSLYLLDEAGALVCETTLSGGVVVNPIVTDGVAYIGTRGNLIELLPAGECQIPSDQLRQFVTETAVTVAPAIVGNVMYLPSGPFLYQIDLETNQHMWAPSTVFADGDIASPPVVDNDTVYFGTESGSAYAVDADSGELLWQWRTGNYVRAAPVVVDGVVFIASGDGNVYAVGPSD